jgi:hypothetical protein
MLEHTLGHLRIDVELHVETILSDSSPGQPDERRLPFREGDPADQKPEQFHWGGREIPNLSILYASDVLLRPRRAAAPRAPPTTQLLSRSARRICSRPACSNALPPLKPGSFRISANGTRSEGPADSRAAGSKRFCSSRMFPASYSARGRPSFRWEYSRFVFPCAERIY